MATATLTINVSAEDLAKLKDLPAQVEGIVKQTKGLLDTVKSGGNPSNALSGLLGNLSSLAGEAKEIPALDSLLAPIQDLMSKLPTGAIGDLKAVASAIEEVLGFFGPLKDAIFSGNIEQAVLEGLTKVLDQSGDLFKPGSDVLSAQSSLTEFFDLFGVMLKWNSSAPHPEEVVRLLSRALIGIPHDIFEEAETHLEAALQPLFEVLPAGPDLTLWRGAPVARLNFWHGINARFSAGATINWPRLEIDLQAELRELVDIRAAKDRLISVTLGNLNRVNFGGFDSVHQAVLKAPAVNPPQFTAFIDGVKHYLNGIIAGLEDWEPTPDELRAAMRGLGDRIAAFMADSPLGELRAILIDFQHRILLAIGSLPFRDLAAEAEEKLREIAKALDVVDPDILRKPIHDFFQKIEDKLHEFSIDSVKGAVQEIWQGVEDAVTQVKQLLENVRATIAGAIDSLKNMVDQAKPTLDQVSTAVDSIKATLDSFDLSEPAGVVIDELHKLKETVAGLDLSSLPGPAVSALKLGANTLRAIDLTAAVNPPLNDALAKIDPTLLIQEAAKAIESVTGKLKLLDPASVVAKLDEPADELLKAIGTFGPDSLKKLLHEALKPIEDAIRSLDIEQLFAPLTHLFAELSAKIDAILDPELIFKPLEAAFKPVTDLIDAVAPEKLIHLFDQHASTAAQHAGGGLHPPAAVAAGSGALQNALKPVVQAEDELFGLRPGDMLLPVIELHHQIAQAVNHIDDSILEPAAKMLHDALHGRLNALNPANLELRITSGLADIQLEFDLGTIGERLAEAEAAYQDAAVAIAAVDLAQLSAGDAVAAGRVVVMLPDLDPLSIVPEGADAAGIVSATVNIEASLDLSKLRGAFGPLQDIEALIPSFLGGAEFTAALLKQALRDLDPAPARVEINNLFDQLGHKLVGLQSALLAGIDEFLISVEDALTPVTPATIVDVASQLHAALKAQLLAFSPATFKDEVKLIFDVVKKPLKAFDPSILVEEINGLRDALIKNLEEIVDELLPDPAPFNALVAELAEFKPSAILAPIVESLQPLSELIAKLDIEVLLQPLIDALARIRGEVPQVISDIEAALDDVLSAFPDGGPASASVSVSASIG